MKSTKYVKLFTPTTEHVYKYVIMETLKIELPNKSSTIRNFKIIFYFNFAERVNILAHVPISSTCVRDANY